jgi:ABC-2 type transport system ATP-binding protein
VIDHGRVIAEGTPAELKSGLGGTVLDITLTDPAAATRAAARLSAALGIDGRADGSSLELTVEDGPRALVDVLRTLDADRLSPTGLTVREPSLDDVFLSLTGHRAAADDHATDTAQTQQRGAA